MSDPTNGGPSRLTGSRALFVLITILLLAPIATGSLTRAIASSDDKDDDGVDGRRSFGAPARPFDKSRDDR